MEIEQARQLAQQLLREHGLTDWRVVFDRAKTRAGVCRFRERTVGLSWPLTQLHSAAEVRDTILHEIAHALVGPTHKHDAVWRATAARLGCSARACMPADPHESPPPGSASAPPGTRSAATVGPRVRRRARAAVVRSTPTTCFGGSSTAVRSPCIPGTSPSCGRSTARRSRAAAGNLEKATQPPERPTYRS